jgi:hypothetical protein
MFKRSSDCEEDMARGQLVRQLRIVWLSCLSRFYPRRRKNTSDRLFWRMGFAGEMRFCRRRKDEASEKVEVVEEKEEEEDGEE